MNISEKLKRHDLFRTLIELKGNPKISLLTEPLWNIPVSYTHLDVYKRQSL